MLPLELYLLFVGAVLLGILTTLWTRDVAIRFELMDHPNPIVPQHVRPVPQLGGISIGVTTAVVLLAVEVMPVGSATHSKTTSLVPWQFLAPGLGFLILGIVDDLKVLQASTKFVFQVILAVMAASLGLLFPWTGIGAIDFPMSALWIVVLVNAFNLTDVCDGFVSGITVIILFFWAHLDPSYAAIAMAVSGACGGFLFFNFPPASIFLGDVGSHFLGFTLGFLMLSGRDNPGSELWLRPLQMILLPAIFLFEVVLLVVVRRKKGVAWWRGSPDHVALRLQAAGLSTLQADCIGWGSTVLYCTAALLLNAVSVTWQVVILLCMMVLTGVCWRLVQRLEVISQ